MDIVGSVGLLVALFAAGYAFVVGIFGISSRRPALNRLARQAGMAIFPLVSLSVACLLYLFITNNFTMAYVAEHSSRALPLVYKFAALWAGQQGSLLFWSWLLSIFAFVALLANRKKHADLMPTVGVILAGVQFFFLLLNNFVASPFQVLGVIGSAGTTRLVTLANGQGLNPLLQYPEMVLHPPLLYLGYTGFTVPFAFALAALLLRSPGERWVRVTRRWTIVAWSFLGIGILLGAHWAYAVLGWGGYWAWDPVENASLLPWITATAFLHAAIMQEKRGMMKVWTVGLLFVTFLLSILGTLLTRSGVVNSVHAFGKSSIGTWLTVFLALLVILCFWAYSRSRPALRTSRRLDSLLSREASFLLGCLLLLFACLAVLCGTLLPVFSEWVEGAKVTVGPPFFDKMAVPVALLLLLLLGITPLLGWGPNSFAHLRRGLTRSFAGGLAAVTVALALGWWQFYAVACLGLSVFAIITIVSQFVYGARAMADRTGVNLFSAVGRLSMLDTRRYGGYVVHLGVVLIFIGISGQAFNRDVQRQLKPGAAMTIGPYTLVNQNFSYVQGAGYQAEQGTIEVFEGGRSVMMLYPERRFYPSSQVSESKVSIYSSLVRDLYVVYEGNSPKDGLPVVHAYLNPLVHWIWLGGLVMVLGTVLVLLPSRSPFSTQPARSTALATDPVREAAAASESVLVSRGGP